MPSRLTTESSMETVGFLPNGLSGPPETGDFSLGDPTLLPFLAPPTFPGRKLADLGGKSRSGLGGLGGMNCNWDGVGEGGQNGADLNESGCGMKTVRPDFEELAYELAEEGC